MTSSLDLVEIVLVRPTRAANVAAACRAMKNMGLRRLTIVTPPPGLSDPAERRLAYGAWDVLDAARHFQTLREAVADCHLVVGTSGRVGPSAWTARRFAAEAAAQAGAGRMAVVFGSEANGLGREELALCHQLVRIPTEPAHPSLNLAQAVLVVAYELYTALEPQPAGEPSQRATAGELEAALSQLEQGLLGIGYLNQQNPAPVLAELRRLLARAAPTPREAGLLRGLARQISWAAARIAEGRRADR